MAVISPPAALPPPDPSGAAPRLRWWALALPAAAFGLLLLVVAGARQTGAPTVPAAFELLGHLRSLLPAALTPAV